MTSPGYTPAISSALLLTGVLLVAISGGMIPGTDAAAQPASDDERMKLLPPEQQALAQRMTDFIERMDDKYFARVETINGSGDYEGLIKTGEYSDYDIRVTRGPVVEKTGRMLAVGKKASPQGGPDNGPLAWGRVYSLDIHPKTPLVGMLHATVVLQFYENGNSYAGGWLDVMPGTRIEEDIQVLHQLVDTHFAKYDKDSKLYRTLMCKGTHDTVFEYRRKPSCSGVSFYGPMVYRDSTEKTFAFIAELFDQFVDSFLDITEKRADDPFTDADLAAQDEMRKRWLIDQLFSDPYASKTVPFETWFLANVPPVVKF
jgi:coproporphyrinogen III oxidase